MCTAGGPANGEPYTCANDGTFIDLRASGSTWPTAGPSEALRFKQVVPHECEQAIENLVSLTINFSNDAMRMSWLLRTIRCRLECVYLIDGPALSKHHCVEDTAALNFITGGKADASEYRTALKPAALRAL
ncbi:uncharacterized protein ACA1_062660 [Acanthamoeba castellanii str. Neff]|uniref:Uncharacterized protein n=1 Tax=Acanthamoeba castellanii (strain ATCC 30010 / Neff) TaxID=1257118 RepID=L8GX37_ACACF|nr:uncharacterized protein ACA1_062660 [Acanthamoeba castellanii str. Neff]ELR17522.1 hypothetical protein ACA1_062660 [Acanthamoeba castellanii str. Neff]